MKTDINANFDTFLHAATCKAVLLSFYSLCESLSLEYPPVQNEASDHCTFYTRLKKKLQSSWKAQSLFSKLDKRFMGKEYFMDGKIATNTRCAEKLSILIIGAGPCGLRCAIEMGLLGAKTVVIEKRDTFSRNNVLHLWPFNITDLKSIGAKKFFGRFCAGAIDHISIRQLQLLLLKATLLIGIEVHVETSFLDIIPPPAESTEECGWRALVEPKTSPVSLFNFDVVVGADGKRNTLEGFKRKCFRGKLAIGITANFMNMRTPAEAQVQEISGVAYIFNQQFFKDLCEKTHIDLENIVYYKDDTHYFVMTAKKHSLLKKGVLRHDYDCFEKLLSHKNVDQNALMSYAKEAADFSTNYQLPNMKFAVNSYGQPDVAVFDFTAMYAAENATFFREVNGHKLLSALVGDSLLEPFWPLGTGCARGFFAAFDTAWMVRSWCNKLNKSKNHDGNAIELDVLKEREALYRLLHQTTPDNTSKNLHGYTINPSTRYPKINYNATTLHQANALYLRGDNFVDERRDSGVGTGSSSLTRNVSFVRSNKLLAWCRSILKDYGDVNVTNMAQSWRDGMALCGIIHRYRPDLIPFSELNKKDIERNNQLAFDVAEEHFGITPVLSGKEMAESTEVDNLLMISYLSQFYEVFKKESPPALPEPEPVKKEATESKKKSKDSLKEPTSPITSTSPVGLLTRFTQKIKRKSVPKNSYTLEKKKKSSHGSKHEVAKPSDAKQVILKSTSATKHQEPVKNKNLEVKHLNGNGDGVLRRSNSFKADVHQRASNRISSLGLQLISQFEQNVDAQNHTSSKVCHFCNKMVYILERNSVEGHFFHRNCFVCCYCGTTLRFTSYKKHPKTGKFYCEAHYNEHIKIIENTDPVVPNKAHNCQDHAEEIDTDLANENEDKVTPMVEISNPTVVKRSKKTPERIELENMRLSMINNPNELSEEDFNELNFSQSVAVDDEDSDTDSSSDTDDSFYMDAFEDGATSKDLLTSYQEKLSKNARMKESLKDRSHEKASKKNSATSTIAEESTDMDVTESWLGETMDADQESLSSNSTSTDAENLTCEESMKILNEVEEKSLKINKGSPKNNILFSSIDDITNKSIASPVYPSPPLPEKFSHAKRAKTEMVMASDFNIKTFTPYLATPTTEDKTMETNEAIITDNLHDGLHTSPSLDNIQNYISSHPIENKKEQMPVKAKLLAESQLSRVDSLDKVQDYLEKHPVKREDSRSSSNVSVSSYSSKDSAAVSSYKSDDEVNTTVTSGQRSTLNDTTSANSINISNKSTEEITAYKPSWTTPRVIGPTPVKEEVKNTFEFMQKRQKKRLKYRKDWFESNEDDNNGLSVPDDEVFTPNRTRSNALSSTTDNEMYYTPLAETPSARDETFYSFSGTGINSNVEALSLSDDEDEMDSDIIKQRKLPETPKKRSLPPLPKLPEFEAIHSTARTDSDETPSSVEKDLRAHEARVKARFQKMKKALGNKKYTTSTPVPQEADKFTMEKSLQDITEESQYINGDNPGSTPKHRKKLKPDENMKSKKPLFPPKRKKKNWRANKSVSAAAKPSTSYDRGSASLTDDLEERIAKKVQIAALKLEKIEKQKRLRRAHVIQRQLEEVEVKQRQLEKRGVELEKVLRQHKPNENSLYMQEWFKLVQERNGLLRYESELMIYQRELQLEDRQSKLKDDWRALVAIPHDEKNSEIYAREKEVLKELLDVVQQRDELVVLLDEQKQKEKEETTDIESIILAKFSDFSEGLEGVFVV